jgi:hypothetical protein
MKPLDKIVDVLKTFPTIMHITQEIKVIHLLEELTEIEILNETDTFNKILGDLELSHEDNYVYENDLKSIKEYNNFIQWLERIKTIDRLKSYKEFIDSVIETMGVYYLEQDNPMKINKLFTEEELEYICISGIFKRKYNGKEYYVIIYLENNGVIAVDENKIVYKITHNPDEIKLLKNELIDYLKENYIKNNGVRGNCI